MGYVSKYNDLRLVLCGHQPPRWPTVIFASYYSCPVWFPPSLNHCDVYDYGILWRGWGVTSEARLSKALWFHRWPLGLLMLKKVCRHFVRVFKQPCGKASVENWDLLPTASTKLSTVWVSHPINRFFRWLQPDQHPEGNLMRDSKLEPASSTTLTFLTHRNDRR